MYELPVRDRTYDVQKVTDVPRAEGSWFVSMMPDILNKLRNGL